MNEWEFTAEVAGWMNEIISNNDELPFSAAKCEQSKRGSQKRRDLTILDRDKRVVLTGEVKLPYQKDGGTPFNHTVVDDARKKALTAGAPFFFTWNVNECVLWQTKTGGIPWQEESYKAWEDIAIVRREEHLENIVTKNAIQDWLVKFLHEFGRIIRGTVDIGSKAPDEKFIQMLESSLNMPIRLTTDKLHEQYKKPRFKTELDKWMREDQGWVILDDAEGIQENLERAAKFTCYAMVNKLVFYEALLKRYGERMGRLKVPDHIDDGESLRNHLEKFFIEARRITGDYETVFGEDHTTIGNRIPFYSDEAVAHWRGVINQIHKFDFSKLDYEVIGSIFEHLIAPEERKKYGQFYTSVGVVDLINSFCIRTGTEKVMDPACGGGTFLVRAYMRKRELDPSRGHGTRLSELYGVDISQFATHLTTINLATRDLIDDENYPQIARSDFFDVMAKKTFISLPTNTRAKGLGRTQHREVEISGLDAVVGNPPYIRQEDIPKTPKVKGKKRKDPKKGTKEYYQKLVKDEARANLSGRSDIHCYFWPHAMTFLKDDGYLCFVTSSQWLDVDYGFGLQEMILKNFEIVAIFESIDEPWFVGARVATTVTILRRQNDDTPRMANMVRFVQLRRPVEEILSHDGTGAGAVRAANAFRDEILSLKKNEVNQRYRARLIRQGDLWKQGVELGVIMGKTELQEDEEAEVRGGDYYGGKWGVYLRAPDLWFNILDRYGSRMKPLGSVASDIYRGITSGKDCFFFPIDCSAECLEEIRGASDFRDTFHVSRNEVESGKVKLVECGEKRGEIRPIEAEYLEPEVHSLMEVDGFTVAPEDCSRLVLLTDKSKAALRGTHALKYIEWGEKQGYHKGSTCAARASESRPWYSLTGHSRGVLFWPKAQQYKHAIPLNDQGLQCNCNLYDIYLTEGTDSHVMGGVLNSTLVILSKYQYGRPVGVEGNLKTEIVDVKMMLVPDTNSASAQAKKRVADAFKKMKGRKALQLLPERRMRQMAYKKSGKGRELAGLSDLCELDMADRQELDDAVFELLGVTSKRERDRLIDELYGYLREFFEWTRQKEEKAIVNKVKSKRGSAARPADIAAQIFDEIRDTRGALLRQYDPGFIDKNKAFDTFDLPAEGEPEAYKDMFIAHAVKFKKGAKEKTVETKARGQDSLIVALAKSGVRGLVRVPRDESECKRVEGEYARFIKARDAQIRRMIVERTADEDMQESIYLALVPLLQQSE